MSVRGIYSKLRYNTNDDPDTSWNQYDGTGITINAYLKSRKADKLADPTGLGQLTWVRIEVKAEEATVFVSTYRPYKNTTGTLTVWNQHVRYFQREHDIEAPDTHELFITDLFVALGSMRDEG